MVTIADLLAQTTFTATDLLNVLSEYVASGSAIGGQAAGLIQRIDPVPSPEELLAIHEAALKGAVGQQRRRFTSDAMHYLNIAVEVDKMTNP